MSPTQNKYKRLGPLNKICNFRHSWLLTILQKRSTSIIHNFLNFYSLKVFLDFLEILRCTLSNPFGPISIWYSVLMYEVLTKKGVFVDFPKWPIMSKFITSCEGIFWSWEMNMKFRELHPIKNKIWMGHFW